MRIETKLNDGDFYESVVSSVCLNLNKFPSELDDIKMLELLKVYAYIRYENKRKNEEDNKINKDIPQM